MTAKEKARRIHIKGCCIDNTGDVAVRCQGCGEIIHETDSLEDVEYVKTKRKSEFFFHFRCAENVWCHRIV